MADAQFLGERAVEELAADHAQGGNLLTANQLTQIAQESGFKASPRDGIRIPPESLPLPRDVPGWRLGSDAARAVRIAAGIGNEPIASNRLADLAGITPGLLSDNRHGPGISFALDHSETDSTVVLRPRWSTGRRFELARLLGDRIVASPRGRLHAATRAYTYRQKMQRSFAAELLSPFEAVEQMLGGDYSGEAQQDVAEYFQVSELTIRTLLVNHHRLEREELDEDAA